MQVASRTWLITAIVALVAAWGLSWSSGIVDSASPTPAPAIVFANGDNEGDTPWD